MPAPATCDHHICSASLETCAAAPAALRSDIAGTVARASGPATATPHPPPSSSRDGCVSFVRSGSVTHTGQPGSIHESSHAPAARGSADVMRRSRIERRQMERAQWFNEHKQVVSELCRHLSRRSQDDVSATMSPGNPSPRHSPYRDLMKLHRPVLVTEL